MNSKIFKILAWILAAWAVTGCDVHEFPEDLAPKEVPLTLHLNFDLEMPPYKEIIYETSTRAENPSDLYDMRYIINIYRSTGGDFTRVPDTTIVVSKPDVSSLNYDVPLSLVPGKYQFLVWADYAAEGSLEDRYYNTSDFTAITLQGKHVGNDDYRDAFRGLQQEIIDLETTDVTVNMSRPMGKYRFVATDFDRFMSRAEASARAEWEQSRAADPEGTSDEPPAVDLDDYKVIMAYPGFMPNIFNMYTNRPADAITGITYEGRIFRLSDTEAELAFDYVFVNGEEAPVSVAVYIYDKNDKLLGASGSVTVPLMRSMLTTVKGEFLTSQASGGVGVSPEFDGEFNIIIR